MSTYLSQNIIEFSNGRDSRVHLFNSPEHILNIYYIAGENGKNPEWLDYSYNKHQLRLDVNVNPKEERKGSIVVVTNLGEHLFDVTLLDYDTTIPVITKDPIRVCVHTTSTAVPYDKGGEITGWVETIGADKLTCSFAYEVIIGTKTKYNAVWDRWPITFKIPAKLNQKATERFIYTVVGTNSNNKAICEGNLLRSKYSGNLGIDEGEDIPDPSEDELPEIIELNPIININPDVSTIIWGADKTLISGSASFTISTTNADSWQCTETLSHFTITKSGNLITVTPKSTNSSSNDYSEALTITASKGTKEVKKTIVLKQRCMEFYLEIGKQSTSLGTTNISYTAPYTTSSYTFYVRSNGVVEINNSQSLASDTNFLDLNNFLSGKDNLAECSVTIPINNDPNSKTYKFTIIARLGNSTLSRTVTITQNYHVADTTLYIYKGALGRNGEGYSVDDDGILTSLTNWGTLEAYNNYVEIVPNVSKLLFVAIPAESSKQVTRWTQNVLGVDQEKTNYKSTTLTKDSKNYKVYYYYNSTSSLSSINVTKIYIS